VNGTAATFMHEGTQYIAIISAGTIYAGGKHGDSIWLFSLEGDVEQEKAPVQSGGGIAAAATPMDIDPVNPPEGHTPDVAGGRGIFQGLCSACHGPNGEGGEAGVELKGKTLSTSDIMTVANYGRNTMPAFGFAYTPEQLHDVATYVIQEILPE